MTGQRGAMRATAGASALRLGLVGLVGLAAATACAVLTAPLQSNGARRLLGPWTSWASSVSPWSREPRSFSHGGLVVVLAVGVLVAAWLVGLAVIVRSAPRLRVVAGVAALWWVPFLVMPPLLSQDAYAYLAQGSVAAAGGDAYRSPVSVLGPESPWVHAVDPLYRGTIAPYGPVAVRLFAACLSLTHHNATLALLLLRLITVVALVVAVALGARLVASDRRPALLWLICASPLVLLHLVGGLHLEALLCGLLVAAFWSYARGATRAAAALVVLAAAIKLTAVVVLAVLLVQSFRARGWRAALGEAVAAVATVLVLVVATVPDPFGWVPALRAPLRVWDPISLPTATALGWGTVSGSSPVAALGALRLAVAVAGVAWMAWCLLTIQRRPLAATAGWLLCATALTGPVLWPWYLVPAVVCLAVGGSRRGLAVAGGLVCAASFAALPMPVVQMQRVSIAAAALVAVATGLLVLRRPGGWTPRAGLRGS